jgi:hypothetical protein
LPKKVAPKKATPKKTAKAAPKLLSGGNPQIAKGYGDEPVQAYIAAMPGWKSAAGKRIDAIVTRALPNVLKAVKWNSPLYGVKEGRYFLGVHVFTRYIKLAFFEGALLKPMPPGASKQAKVRYLDIHETDAIDEKQLTAWIKQAGKLPGEKM